MAYYERNLPHWQPEGKAFFLTWRLHGSLPAFVVKFLHESDRLKSGRVFVRFDGSLDRATFGPTWLRNADIAKTVTNCIFSVVSSTKSVLHAYVIMPNHIHILLEPNSPLREITQAIKGRSARDCNKILNRSGKPFWHEETYDHWVRSPQSFEKIRNYIERNPVSANLVKSPQDWPWSSASSQKQAPVTQASACAPPNLPNSQPKTRFA